MLVRTMENCQGKKIKKSNSGNPDITTYKPTTLYNLDVILAVKYRVNSKIGKAYVTNSGSDSVSVIGNVTVTPTPSPTETSSPSP